jgi:hypothetical protein
LALSFLREFEGTMAMLQDHPKSPVKNSDSAATLGFFDGLK